jgi:hypothetical protein
MLFLDGAYVERSRDIKSDTLFAWAVHSGDVGAAIVPLPAAIWLFGSGLLGLISMLKQQKTG